MEANLLEIRCPSSHTAVKVCVDKNCVSPAPICEDHFCDSHRNHQRCLVTTEPQKLIDALTAKRRKYDHIIHSIIQAYDDIIKAATRDKLEYQVLMEEPWANLGEEEKKMLQLIKQGPVDGMRPALVARVVQSLTNELQNSNIEDTERIILQNVQQQIWHFDIVLAGLKRFWSIPESTQKPIPATHPIPAEQVPPPTLVPSIEFSETLCSPSISISENGKVARYTSIQNDGFRFAFLKPCIDTSPSPPRRFIFKMISGNDFYMGLGYKDEITSNGFKWDYRNANCYLISTYGRMFSGNKSDKSLSQSTFSIVSEDQFEVCVDTAMSEVWFFNRRSRIESKHLTLSQKEGDSLHLCVILCETGSQVRFLGQMVDQ